MSEAVLARNLFGAMPIEQVIAGLMPSSANRALMLRAMAMASPRLRSRPIR
jgi:hypothetical protein